MNCHDRTTAPRRPIGDWTEPALWQGRLPGEQIWNSCRPIPAARNRPHRSTWHSCASFHPSTCQDHASTLALQWFPAMLCQPSACACISTAVDLCTALSIAVVSLVGRAAAASLQQLYHWVCKQVTCSKQLQGLPFATTSSFSDSQCMSNKLVPLPLS